MVKQGPREKKHMFPIILQPHQEDIFDLPMKKSPPTPPDEGVEGAVLLKEWLVVEVGGLLY